MKYLQVKEVVRTASLKGRRGRLPSKPKTPHEAGSSGTNNNQLSNPNSSLQSHQSIPQHSMLSTTTANEAQNTVISALLRSHIESSPDPNHVDIPWTFQSSDGQRAERTMVPKQRTRLVATAHFSGALQKEKFVLKQPYRWVVLGTSHLNEPLKFCRYV